MLGTPPKLPAQSKHHCSRRLKLNFQQGGSHMKANHPIQARSRMGTKVIHKGYTRRYSRSLSLSPNLWGQHAPSWVEARSRSAVSTPNPTAKCSVIYRSPHCHATARGKGEAQAPTTQLPATSIPCSSLRPDFLFTTKLNLITLIMFRFPAGTREMKEGIGFHQGSPMVERRSS